jgi:flagellar biosynthesis protein FliQ
VPKLLALGIVMLLAGPWMLRSLISFATALLTRLPTMAP